MVRITVYAKVGCHLCNDVIRTVETVRERIPFDLDKIDIRSDPDLMAKYGFDIPVVEIDGITAFTHFLSEAQLETKLKEFTTLDEN